LVPCSPPDTAPSSIQRIIAERNDLFRGMIEDRYVGSFLDHRPYAIEAREARADRIASVIELLRVAALSSYENRPISTGVLLLGTSNDPCRPDVEMPASAPTYTESTTAIKSLFRLADGVRTVFLANSEGRLLDIIDIERLGQSGEPASDAAGAVRESVSTTRARHAAARPRLRRAQPVARDSRSSLKVRRSSRSAAPPGTCSNLQAKYRLWAEAVGR
jgi:hypothetical protein